MTTASEVDLADAAAESVWAARVVALTHWVGTGRKLTQAGRLTLADARTLIGLLNTADEFDPVIGGQLFRTKSSEELREVNAVVEWAKAARLVRVIGGKLMPVKKSAILLDRPLPLWQRMFEVFGQLGPAICPSGWGESLLRRHFDAGLGVALPSIHTCAVESKGGPAPVTDVCTRVWESVSHGYRIETATDSQQTTWRRLLDRDVRRAFGLLAQFGAVRLTGPQPDEAVELTPLGRWALGQ
jgi:hypothetical protein